MAEAAVNMVIETLGTLLVEEIKLLGDVKKEVESIKNELDSLRSFLKDADAKAAVEELEGGGEENVRTWVKQLRNEAYRIEDVIDEYTLMVAKIPHGSGLIGVRHRLSRFKMKLKLCHGVPTEIQDIKSSLADIKRRGESYRFRPIHERSSCSTATRSIIPHDSRVGSYFIEDDEIVGIESTRDKLINFLTSGPTQRSVVALVGEGGLGKTTIVGKLFNSEPVKSHFDCQAWFTVGKEYHKRDLLRTIIKEFYRQTTQPAPVDIDTMEEMNLITTLRDHLKDKSYMAVFDDVWKIYFWRDVEHALLDNKKSSRVMVTTRRMIVADFCRLSSFVQVHELESLPPNEAWKLFCRKAFGPSSESYCPSELKELSKSILAKCGGLPIAILAVGGHLSSKKTVVSEWTKLLDGLGSKLGSDPYLKDCNRVLSEGYYDLPHHLKSCLLYFGLFPESFKINSARLMRLWIAEGFVQNHRGVTCEQTAEEYLNELIEGSLVQVSERYVSGRVKTCQVHDLVYQIIIRKTEELGFCRLLKADDSGYYSKTRRISFIGASETIKDPKVRSLFLFNVDELPQTFMKTIIANFKLMKVLDLKDAPVNYLPEGMGNLFNLHYLSVRNTKVKKIPRSIGKLINLEFLDLKKSLVSELPVEIMHLKKLRYLVVYHSENATCIFGVRIHEGIGSLIHIQKLLMIEANSQVLKELSKLRHLRKLGISVSNDGNDSELCKLIANLENLESLFVVMRSKEDILDLQSLTTPPQNLQFLNLRGNMRKLPDWIFKLKSLVRISLTLSGLTDDVLRVLQSMPNLLQLTLMKSYQYEVIHFEAGWFPKLQKLSLYDFETVRSVKIEKGAMPNLREFLIGCMQLMEIPSGIEHLTNLKLLDFWDMPRQFCAMRKHKMWKEVTQHIPEIHFSYVMAGDVFYVTTKFLSSLLPEDFDKFMEQVNSS